MDAGQEAYDDANDREGDGCNTDCQISGEQIWCLDDFGASADAATAAPPGASQFIGTASEDGAPEAWLEVVAPQRRSARVDGAAGIGVAFLPTGPAAI